MAQRFYKFRTLLILLAGIVMFFGCGKNGNVRWVHYDETQCSDKWEYSVNNEKLKENVTAYLEKKNVKVFEIEIFTDRPSDGCADCYCKTGRRIKCKIKKNDVKEVKGVGFYE